MLKSSCPFAANVFVSLLSGISKCLSGKKFMSTAGVQAANGKCLLQHSKAITEEMLRKEPLA